MEKFYPKAVRVYQGGTWECIMKNGMKQFQYKGGFFKDSGRIASNSLTYDQFIKLILDVCSLDSIRKPKVYWLVRGVRLQLDSSSSVLVWWTNTIPSSEGVVTVYLEGKAVTGGSDKEHELCDAGIQSIEHVNVGAEQVNQHARENPSWRVKNKTRRQKLPVKKKNFYIEDLSEEELDPLPSCHVEAETEEEGTSHLKEGDNSHVPNGESEDVPMEGILVCDVRRRRVDIDQIDPDDVYHSDQSDDNWDPEEENGAEFIEDEEADQYVLDSELHELAIKNITCDPLESEVVHDKRKDEWKLEIGMKWNTKEEARHYIRTFAIRNRFSLKKEHNDGIRLRFKCSEEGCHWFIRVRKLPDSHTFKLKNGVLTHNCCPNLSGRTKMANARWIAKEIENEVRIHKRSYRPKQIIEKMRETHYVRLLYWQAWHARAIALESIHGSYEESYNKLQQLCRYLLEANPGSIMTTSRDDNSKKWTGTCISFKASLEGFVRGCRPLVGIDGCFLKGKYGGVCLAMTSLDGNNGLFPLAIYLCQAENKENWIRFFLIMKDALNKHPQKLIIMSDRQKGLDAAVEIEFPNATQRYCFRHIFGNMKEYHRGGMIEEYTWNAARAYTIADFKKWMEMLDANTKKKAAQHKEGETSTQAQTVKKKANEKTPIEYLMSEDPKYWARAYMPIDPKVEHITNNFSESFNSWILELRDKPVHKMVIDLTLMMMNLIYKKKKDAKNMGEDDDIVPRVKKIIDSHIEWMRHYIVAGSSDHNFCVQSSAGTWWNVDLEKHTCDCKKWDISGIPCVHAVASIAQFESTRKIQWSRYCSPLFTVKQYKAAYSGWIKPPLHESMWDSQPSDVRPPLLHRRAGRPRVNRKRGRHEGPISVGDNQRRCSTCSGFGHNKGSCQMGQTKAQANTTRNQGESTSGKKSRTTNRTATGSTPRGKRTKKGGSTQTSMPMTTPIPSGTPMQVPSQMSTTTSTTTPVTTGVGAAPPTTNRGSTTSQATNKVSTASQVTTRVSTASQETTRVRTSTLAPAKM